MTYYKCQTINEPGNTRKWIINFWNYCKQKSPAHQARARVGS